jgi:hypothetical protein
VSRPSLKCLLCPPPYKVWWWARGWWIVGDGPSYLLYRAEEKRVTHLVSQGAIPQHLGAALQGFQVIEEGKLNPLLQALISVDTADTAHRHIEDAIRAKVAGDTVLSEIERLIYQLPDEKIFAGQLARFSTLIRAARRYQAEHHGPEFEISLDDERSKISLIDRHGQEVLISDCFDGDGPKRVFKCVPHSRVVECARTLWHREQDSFDSATSLYYVRPVRSWGSISARTTRPSPSYARPRALKGWRVLLGKAVNLVARRILCVTMSVSVDVHARSTDNDSTLERLSTLE